MLLTPVPISADLGPEQLRVWKYLPR